MIRVLTGLGGVAVIVALTIAGLWGLIDTYLVETNTDYLLAMVGTAVVAGGFVFGLFVLGARPDSWFKTPYW